MKSRIKRATEKDLGSILSLIREFAEFEDLLNFLEVSEEKLHDVMFGEQSFLKGLVAFDADKPIAYALFYPAFLSFRGQRSVYLEDIFITKEFRKYGVGEKMLREVARIGKEDLGAVRMDFQVLAWNEPALNFYKKHGAIIDEDERHFKFIDENFRKLVES